MKNVILVVLFVLFNIHSLWAFRLPASVTTGPDKKSPIGNNDADLLKLTHAEEVILRIENGEIDVYLDLKKVNFLLGKEKIKLKKGMKLLSRNKIKIQFKGKKKAQKLRAFIRGQIIEQTSYLYGILQSPGYSEALDVKKGAAGVLGENHIVGGITIKGVESKKLIVGYKYYFTKALISKDILKNSSKRRGIQETIITTHLPSTTKESKIYHKGCTDDHYSGFGDYWYFYDPYKEGCYEWMNQKRRTVEVDVKFRKPKHYEKSISHYPDFNKLYKDNQIKMIVLIGYNNHMNWKNASGKITSSSIKEKLETLKTLISSKNSDMKINQFLKNNEDEGKRPTLDVGMENWDEMQDVLKELNFKKIEERKWFSLGYHKIKKKKNLPGLNNFARYEKKLKGNKVAILDMLITDTDIASPDATFPLFWKKSIEEYEVISYNGHSGLGANLDLDGMNIRLKEVNVPKLQFKKNYQIIFFNGCSTYSYYNKKYFKAKGGSKNLETILTGLPAYYSDMPGNNKAFLGPFSNFDIISYPELVGDIENTNLVTGTTLLFVNGEQDNPRSPRDFEK